MTVCTPVCSIKPNEDDIHPRFYVVIIGLLGFICTFINDPQISTITVRFDKIYVAIPKSCQ